MDKVKLSTLKGLEECAKRHYLSTQIGSDKNVYYHMSIGIRDTVSKALQGKIKAKSEIEEILNEKIPERMFLPLEREANISYLSTLISRYVHYLFSNGYQLVESSVIEEIAIGKHSIVVSADLVLKDINNNLHIVKLHRGAPKLSYVGRKEETIPHRNIELYLLRELGKQRFNNANAKIFGSFHHMKGKADKNQETKDFEAKKGYNMISYEFPKDSENEYVVEKINSLIEKLSKEDFKPCQDKYKCERCNFENICNFEVIQEAKLEKVKEIEKAPRDFKLTESQKEAVLNIKGVSRINAGAGSGKTTVVALRVAELILGGCRPEDILMTTFTNKGAQEMRDKVIYWINKEGIEIDPEKLNITTFNSWGDKIIRDNYKKLGFKKEPELIEKVQHYDILFKLLSKYPKLEGFNYANPIINFRYSQGAVVKLSNIFNIIKVNKITTEDELSVKTKETLNLSQILEMYNEYSKILKNRGLIEYQDQINMVMELIEEDSPILDKYNYKHIIADEFQDTDIVQIDLILFLTNQPKFESLMVVGDDSQSIFGFRGTNQENILNFHLLFNEVTDIQIMENFRSTPEIINLANYVNSLNKKRVEKELVSKKKNGEKPKLITFFDSQQEHRIIARKIKELLREEDIQEEDIAVIARTKYELFSIQEELNNLGIPNVLDIPEPLLNNFNIHMAKNLLDFLRDTDLTQGLYEYLIVKTDNFKNSTEDAKSILDKEKEKIEEMIKERVFQDESSEEDKTLIEEVKKEIFFEMVEEIKDDDFQEFVKDIKSKNMPFSAINNYLTKFIKYEDPKTIEKDDVKYRAVTLTTAHTSKGKEFEIVFNTITKYTPDNCNEDIEEERRLLFVSLTRAKELLYITYTKPNYNSRSRKYHGFYKEIYKYQGIEHFNMEKA